MSQPNYDEAQAQIRLMKAEGWRLCQRKAVSRLPRTYATPDYQWRISTAPGGLWKLERFNREMHLPGVGWIRKYDALIRPRFQTPLAMALWFNMVRRIQRLGAVKL